MPEGGLIVHTDGGARGNPGPAACAFVAEEGEKIIYKGSKYLGSSTNNSAEYQGVILALKWIEGNKESLLNQSVTFYLDSELVVRQLNGLYKVKDQKLRALYFQISTTIQKLELKIAFKNIPRNRNKIADFLVNKELDKKV